MLYVNIQSAKRVITEQLELFKNPIVMVSFGKDSMVLLHLMRTIIKNIPVLFIRDPITEWKQEFANKIIKDWKLIAHGAYPSEIQFTYNEKQKYLYGIELYGAEDGFRFIFPQRLNPSKKGSPFVCLLKDYLYSNKMKQTLFPWDLVFAGQKNADQNEFYDDDIVLKKPVRDLGGGSTMVFPLLDWSDEDVWEYIDKFEVPYNKKRYDRKHTTDNNDYIEGCSLCINPSSPNNVYCELEKKEISNLSDQMGYGTSYEEYKEYMIKFFNGDI